MGGGKEEVRRRGREGRGGEDGRREGGGRRGEDGRREGGGRGGEKEEWMGRSFTLVETPYRLHAPPLCQSTSCHCMSAEVKVSVNQSLFCAERKKKYCHKVNSEVGSPWG